VVCVGSGRVSGCVLLLQSTTESAVCCEGAKQRVYAIVEGASLAWCVQWKLPVQWSLQKVLEGLVAGHGACFLNTFRVFLVVVSTSLSQTAVPVAA
jgi:hypothetical protein